MSRKKMGSSTTSITTRRMSRLAVIILLGMFDISLTTTAAATTCTMAATTTKTATTTTTTTTATATATATALYSITTAQSACVQPCVNACHAPAIREHIIHYKWGGPALSREAAGCTI